MGRKSRQDQKRSQASKAKLDSKGRPLATQVQETPEQDEERTDHKPVRTLVRLGVFAFALTSQTGCEPEPDAQPAAIDPRIETALADARVAAQDSLTSAELSAAAAAAAGTSADLCIDAAKRAEAAR